MFRPSSEKTGMSITDIIELGRVYENHTPESCLKMENVVKYMELHKG